MIFSNTLLILSITTIDENHTKMNIIRRNMLHDVQFRYTIIFNRFSLILATFPAV